MSTVPGAVTLTREANASGVPVGQRRPPASSQGLVGERSSFATVMFFLSLLLFFLSIALVRLMVGGVPVRSLLTLLMFGLVSAARPHLLRQALRDMRAPLLVIAYAAAVGAAVSVFNNLPLPSILRQLAEIHGQAVLGVVTGYALLRILGAERLVRAFVLVVALSSVVSVLQVAGIDLAWRVRDALQQLQTYDVGNIFLEGRLRAMGLSFSPVHLGTQLCLAFALFYCLRLAQDSASPAGNVPGRVWIAVAAALLVSVVSGNRSPILGLVVFMVAAALYLRPAPSVLLALILLPAVALLYLNASALMELLAGSGLRAFRMGDKSSEGRNALRAFGLLLFADRPFGYGLAFSSTDHVKAYWSQLGGFANAETVWGNAIHNYYLNVLHKYGVLILPLVPYVGRALWKRKLVLLAFVPYAVHIFFHNDGPLQSDFLIWYFVAFFAAVSHALDKRDRGFKPRGVRVAT